MRVVVTTEARFRRREHRGGAGPAGRKVVLAPSVDLGYQRWASCLGVFDEVVVLARVAGPEDGPAPGAVSEPGYVVEGPGVRVVPLPDCRGLAGYLATGHRLRAAVREALAAAGALGDGDAARPEACCIATVPGLVGATAIAELRRHDVPYAIEVGADAEAAVSGPLRPLVGRCVRGWQARVCAQAPAVGYLTRELLQRRYPPNRGAATAWYAHSRLRDADFARHPRPVAARPPAPARLLAAVPREGDRRGHDVLVDAVMLLRAWRHPVLATVVGTPPRPGGLLPAVLRRGRADLGGLDEVVDFVADHDRALLDSTDLLVLPSRLEGLPPLLLDAMARGVPVIAAEAGVAAELLAPRDLVPPGDAESLAARVAEVLCSPRRLAEMSAHNHAVAAHYHGELLAARAREFHLRCVELVTRAAGPGGAGGPTARRRQPAAWPPAPRRREAAPAEEVRTEGTAARAAAG